MRKLLSVLATAGLASAPAAQAQDTAEIYKPTGGWTADYGEDYCRLIRTFSNGEEEVSVALERTQPGEPVRLVFVGNSIKTYRSAEQIGYHFLPSGSEARSRFFLSETADGQQYMTFDPVMLAPIGGSGGITSVVARQDFSQNSGGSVPNGQVASAPPPYNRTAEQEIARAITGLSLSTGLASPVQFETGSLRAPIAALQTCSDDLLKEWGLDPEQHKTMTASVVPNPNPDGVLPQGTIPFTEFGKLNGGANDVRLVIGADGKPSSCTVRSPSLAATVNERICKLAMERASFQPAKDASGAPMASFWMGSPMFLGPLPSGGR